MNASFNSDPTLYPPSSTAGISGPSGYSSPLVPISVYRELAAELKTTQSTVEALTKQNHQLVRQNKLLRNEIQRFVQAAEKLGQFAGVIPQEPPATRQDHASVVRESSVVKPVQVSSAALVPQRSQEEIFVPEPVTSSQKNEIVIPTQGRQRDRAKSPQLEPIKQHLFTEQPENRPPLSKTTSRPDLGNLWLAITIFMVIFTAFGAGFLIMRPLLSR